MKIIILSGIIKLLLYNLKNITFQMIKGISISMSSPAMFTHSFGFFAMKYCLWLGVKNREPADLDCYR